MLHTKPLIQLFNNRSFHLSYLWVVDFCCILASCITKEPINKYIEYIEYVTWPQKTQQKDSAYETYLTRFHVQFNFVWNYSKYYNYDSISTGSDTCATFTSWMKFCLTSNFITKLYPVKWNYTIIHQILIIQQIFIIDIYSFKGTAK